MTTTPTDFSFSMPDDWFVAPIGNARTRLAGLVDIMDIAASGIVPDGAKELTSMSYLAESPQREGIPLIGSMVMVRRPLTEHERGEATWSERVEGNRVIVSPGYHETTRTIDWPEVGEVLLLEYEYEIPTPDGSVLVVWFATPNLPERESMERMFADIATSVRFVDHSAPD